MSTFLCEDVAFSGFKSLVERELVLRSCRKYLNRP
jgi:hypothetical protein